MVNLKLGNRIKALRKARGVVQDDLAREIGVHKQSLSKYERGIIAPSAEVLIKIFSLLNPNPHWLLTGEGEMFVENFSQDGILAEEVIAYNCPVEPSRSAFLLDKTLRNISGLLKQNPELIKICSDITELFVYLFDKPYEKEMFIEILEGMLNNLREKRLKVIK